MNKIIGCRFKVIHIPIINIFKIKDLQKEFKFKVSYWSDGNKTIKYKHKDSFRWFDLGFNGTLYNMNDLRYNLENLMEANDE
jgi:hypothetical protein